MQKRNKGLGMWLLAAVMIFLVFSLFVNISRPTVQVAYSDFVKLVKSTQIKEIDLCGDEITAQLKDVVQISDKYKYRELKVRIPSTDIFYNDVGSVMQTQIDADELKLTVCEPKVSWMNFALPIVSIVLMVFLIIFFVEFFGKLLLPLSCQSRHDSYPLSLNFLASNTDSTSCQIVLQFPYLQFIKMEKGSCQYRICFSFGKCIIKMFFGSRSTGSNYRYGYIL